MNDKYFINIILTIVVLCFFIVGLTKIIFDYEIAVGTFNLTSAFILVTQLLLINRIISRKKNINISKELAFLNFGVIILILGTGAITYYGLVLLPFSLWILGIINNLLISYRFIKLKTV